MEAPVQAKKIGGFRYLVLDLIHKYQYLAEGSDFSVLLLALLFSFP